MVCTDSGNLVYCIYSITCFSIKEKSTVNVDSPSVGQMFKALIQNDQVMAVVIAIVLINCSLYITSNLVIYFFKYDVGGEGWMNSYTLFNTFGGGIQIISMMIFSPRKRKVIDFNMKVLQEVDGGSIIIRCGIL